MALIKYTTSQRESLSNVVLKNAPRNNQNTSPKIQKDIVHYFAQEMIRHIIIEISDDLLTLLVDESSDVSYDEQMPVILRFIDEVSIVKERFISFI